MKKKRLYDFTGEPCGEDGPPATGQSDQTSATGTHIVDGWDAYQRWLHDLQEDIQDEGERGQSC